MNEMAYVFIAVLEETLFKIINLTGIFSSGDDEQLNC